MACTPTDEFGSDRARLESALRYCGFAPVAANDLLTEHSWGRPAAPCSAVGTTPPEEQ
ncbi:hypothetical protein [Streptomyces sp. NRRL F-5053]|uniref:hypothetical protein n=1 Tax=Streptomyces sp. NRRL F-5053 TaxID=1463854 RepID=UPI000A9DD7CC|nr:hypothetical protein [Streptomyces sp. NRRL F-5053]